eukprot:CAMPEP_0177480100 /NCGR_PEP_ID=MMETSP0369-20130122/25625_1 /TAXON_ID=447022 ORGANISM="Scrippsiella hangoei-like, Strain SHHI-4" /NCGR_SAMPLE_ID=MMETSP0369 /ASSEMBLY_ACC=CAM_ASM_000364 /LENGTH=349 /DNA_ID=CAMNT_0018955745 /DNA_START=82 /DNA_END=1128 /DNA_ORIENTATION=+
MREGQAGLESMPISIPDGSSVRAIVAPIHGQWCHHAALVRLQEQYVRLPNGILAAPHARGRAANRSGAVGSALKAHAVPQRRHPAVRQQLQHVAREGHGAARGRAQRPPLAEEVRLQAAGRALLKGQNPVVRVLGAGAVHRVDAVPQPAAAPVLTRPKAQFLRQAVSRGGMLQSSSLLLWQSENLCLQQGLQLTPHELGGRVQGLPEVLGNPAELLPLRVASARSVPARHAEVVAKIRRVGLDAALHGARQILAAVEAQQPLPDGLALLKPGTGGERFSPELVPAAVVRVWEGTAHCRLSCRDLQEDGAADRERLHQSAAVTSPRIDPWHSLSHLQLHPQPQPQRQPQR